MDGDVIEIAPFSRQKRMGELRNELEAERNRSTALNQQNMRMWYALNQLAAAGSELAKETLAEVERGTTFRGTIE